MKAIELKMKYQEEGEGDVEQQIRNILEPGNDNVELPKVEEIKKEGNEVEDAIGGNPESEERQPVQST